ncbi:hypothetical protein KKA95_00720, partial [Patescibacteria group bacterium]|nr:hypothetical protein [Patescibacteria group bacterium]
AYGTQAGEPDSSTEDPDRIITDQTREYAPSKFDGLSPSEIIFEMLQDGITVDDLPKNIPHETRAEIRERLLKMSGEMEIPPITEAVVVSEAPSTPSDPHLSPYVSSDEVEAVNSGDLPPVHNSDQHRLADRSASARAHRRTGTE